MSIDNEEVCNKCKFFHYYLDDTEGTCRRRAPICNGGSSYRDMATWPKVYGNTMFCGEFVNKLYDVRKNSPDIE